MSSDQLALARAIQKANREADRAYQEKHRQEYKGFTLQPVVGFTGSASNAGWEVVKKRNPKRYLGSLALAKRWVDQHLSPLKAPKEASDRVFSAAWAA